VLILKTKKLYISFLFFFMTFTQKVMGAVIVSVPLPKVSSVSSDGLSSLSCTPSGCENKSVVILGSNFGTDATVLGFPVGVTKSCTRNSDTQITCVLNKQFKSTAGKSANKIKVQNLSTKKTSAAAISFEINVLTPIIKSITPSTVTNNGNVDVEITGINLDPLASYDFGSPNSTLPVTCSEAATSGGTKLKCKTTKTPLKSGVPQALKKDTSYNKIFLRQKYVLNGVEKVILSNVYTTPFSVTDPGSSDFSVTFTTQPKSVEVDLKVVQAEADVLLQSVSEHEYFKPTPTFKSLSASVLSQSIQRAPWKNESVSSFRHFYFQWKRDDVLLGKKISSYYKRVSSDGSIKLEFSSNYNKFMEGLYSLVISDIDDPSKFKESAVAYVSFKRPADCKPRVRVTRFMRALKSIDYSKLCGFKVPRDYNHTWGETGPGEVSPDNEVVAVVYDQEYKSHWDGKSIGEQPWANGNFSILSKVARYGESYGFSANLGSFSNGVIDNDGVFKWIHSIQLYFNKTSTIISDVPLTLGIYTPPKNIQVANGETAYFSVQATGIPIKYSLYKIFDDERNLVVTGSDRYLAVSNVSETNIGNYIVVVEDVYGKTVESAPVTLSLAQ
jgi:hypothetical protein